MGVDQMAGRKVLILGEVYDLGLEIGGGPIYPPPGGRPPGIWGGAPPNYVDIGGPPPQPGVWPGPGYPAHPIAPGGPPPYPSHPIPPTVWPTPPGGAPPGVWGGANQPFPTPPIAPGGPPSFPAHPIPPVVWPPGPGSAPLPPLEIWGGAPVPHPDHELPEGEHVPVVE
jgi:hypothetical protein